MKTYIHMDFDARRIPGGVDAILGPSNCAAAVTETRDYSALGRTFVTVTLEETDHRVAQVFHLLAQYGEQPDTWRRDVYTEDELQAAPLIAVRIVSPVHCFGGPQLGTTYDESNACPKCGTGAIQTSDMILDVDALKTLKKHPFAATYYQDMLVTDELAEKLLAANVRGLSLRKVFAKLKDGSLMELPRKQLIAAHTMPPMAHRSLPNRSGECPQCHRGGMTPGMGNPLRFIYRRRDLRDIDDVNVTWEWMGQTREIKDPTRGLYPYPYFLITPKVMNILRPKKPNESIWFAPIWIED